MRKKGLEGAAALQGIAALPRPRAITPAEIINTVAKKQIARTAHEQSRQIFKQDAMLLPIRCRGALDYPPMS